MDLPAAPAQDAARPVLADAPSFIERQFPVSLVSKESYRERKAGDGQTLTPLGTYWKGRKPLVLVRAVVLGLLLPATDDPARDRDIFLKLMLMDRDGLKRRKSDPIKPERAEQLLPLHLHEEAFEKDQRTGKLRWRRSLQRVRRDELELLAFDRMSTDEKLEYCRRIEEMGDDAWAPVWPEVNAHLARFGIRAHSLPELVEQLGRARFGHRPRVGDPFCGGGSIPFEAARIGCDVYASDLNPIACMLTWGALNIIGAPPETRARIAEAQSEVARAVDAEITAMGVEHDGEEGDLRLPADAPDKWPHGWRVDRSGTPLPPEAEPYAVRCPRTGWLVPMLDTLQVQERSRTILSLIPDPARRAYRLRPEQGVSDSAWRAAASGTVVREDGGPGGVTFYLRHDPGGGEVRVRIANRAKAFLYCLETRCPRTGWLVPLLPRRDISEKMGVMVTLKPDHPRRCFRIHVLSGVPDPDIESAKGDGTVKDRALAYVLDGQPHVTPIATLRGDVSLRSRYASPEEEEADRARYAACPNKYAPDAANMLRRWEVSDIAPRPEDIWQERLYCIQWLRPDGEAFFAEVTEADAARERQVREHVEAHLAAWQRAGLVPDMPIEPGQETTRLFRERGWTFWHHLFTPRQILQLALWQSHARRHAHAAALATVTARILDYTTRLTRWNTSRTRGSGSPANTFDNQALNTFYNYATRGLAGILSLQPNYELPGAPFPPEARAVETRDARHTATRCDIWITDPPYADAIVYHEITEFFIAWLRKNPPPPFDQWTWDSRRRLAIQGKGHGFRTAMVEAYRAMAQHMPENGLQVVMFTHQDTAVWADLAAILWAAGLQATAAWCVVTETDSATRDGNVVQGTVLLILRKRREDNSAFLARLLRPIELAVERQLATMRDLNPKDEPDFGDTDFQLAAYAAALKELTAYGRIEGKPVADEVLATEGDSATYTRVKDLLDRARRLASDFLIPQGLPRDVWTELNPTERFYVKGLELERQGEARYAAFQELARGFGVHDFRDLLASDKANEARLKTAAELKARNLRRAGTTDRAEDRGMEEFAGGLVRHALYGVYLAIQQDDVRAPLPWFKDNVPDYWQRQRLVIALLDYLAEQRTPKRLAEAEWAAKLAGAVRNHRP